MFWCTVGKYFCEEFNDGVCACDVVYSKVDKFSSVVCDDGDEEYVVGDVAGCNGVVGIV